MRKWLWALVMVLLLGVVAGCAMFERPAVVKLCGEIEVPIKAYGEDAVRVNFPESEYTISFDFSLGSDFLELEDPEWWDNLQAWLVGFYREEREYNLPALFIKKIPPVKWLKENVRREPLPSYYHLVEFNLPPGGKLRRTVDKEMYEAFVKYGWETKHIILGDGSNIYTLWGTSEYPSSGVYLLDLTYIQDTKDGLLLFEHSDGSTYTILELPEELQEMRGADLRSGHPYEKVITAKTYCH